MSDQLHNIIQKSGMVAHAYNSSTQEAEIEDCHKFKVKLGYNVKPFLKNNNKNHEE